MTYYVLLTFIGAALVAEAVLRRISGSWPVSMAIVLFVAGFAVFALPIGLTAPDVVEHREVIERLTETAVLISLWGAGIKIDRKIHPRSWTSAWRLLFITMPLTIAAVALLGVTVGGLGVGAAILLGGALAPTDPVLASDVQTGPPGSGERDEVRFGLTAEAGLNDGLAFPFVHAGVAAIAAGGGASWVGGWVLEDVIWRLGVGVICGAALGAVLGWLVFSLPGRVRLADEAEGLIALAGVVLVYGVTELLHGYGFLAVFVAAVTIRSREREHDYHRVLHEFSESAERLLVVLLLIGLGGAVWGGVLDGLRWVEVAIGAALVLVVRPVAGLVGLVGLRLPPQERRAMAFFGVRGIGTLYYVAYAAGEISPDEAPALWRIAVAAIVISLVVHGITASPVMAQLDVRRRGRSESVGARSVAMDDCEDESLSATVAATVTKPARRSLIATRAGRWRRGEEGEGEGEDRGPGEPG